MHRPFINPTQIYTDAIPNKYAGLKRKSTITVEAANKKVKHPAYFIPELAHVVALCNERIPFTQLAQEVNIPNFSAVILFSEK